MSYGGCKKKTIESCINEHFETNLIIFFSQMLIICVFFLFCICPSCTYWCVFIQFSDGEPIKLPDNLESLPRADHFPTQRHRWNTNEVSFCLCNMHFYTDVHTKYYTRAKVLDAWSCSHLMVLSPIWKKQSENLEENEKKEWKRHNFNDCRFMELDEPPT